MKKKLGLLLTGILFISSCSSNKENITKEESSTNITSSITESSSSVESSSSFSIEESSTEEISSSSESSIEESSSELDTSFIDEAYEDSQEVLIIKDMFEFEDEVDRTLNANNVFLNQKYSYVGSILSSYPDDNKTKLTDGITTDMFDYDNWVGISDSTDDSVTFDLSKKVPRVGDISVHMLQVIDYAIYYPYSVRLEVSYDNSVFYKLGEVLTPTDISKNSNYTYKFSFEKYCSASYYRFTFTRVGNLTQKNRFFFIDEITANDYTENGTTKEDNKEFDYCNYSLNTSSTTTTVSPSDSDYDTYQNLALLDGVDVDIKSFYGLSKKELLENSPISQSIKLHDGITTKNMTGDEYFKFAYGNGREIVFDLGNIMAVNSLEFDALSKFSSYIQVPNSYSVELSVNGNEFVSVGGEFTGKLMSESQKVYTFTCDFANTYKARYVKLSFINDTNLDYLPNKVWISEVKIMGYKNSTGKEEAKYDKSIINGNYPNPENYGVENILFSVARENYYFTEENAIPLLAYLDKDGNIQDYFFDSIILYGGFMTSLDDKKQDNEKITDVFFESNKHLDALEKAMGTVNAALKQDKKLKIFLSINAVDLNAYCSDVDNDGKAEDLSNTQDLTDFVLYQVNYALNKFNAKNYQNLELVGFYYAKEYISENKLSITLPAFNAVNDYIHSKDLISCWCPFNGVDTIGYWKLAGFDFACYQPNYMFNEVEINVLSQTALEAKINGMGVEIEIESVNNDFFNERYYQYLEYSIAYGHNTSIKMYYYGAIPGAYYQAYNSNYDIYEITYKYAKNILEAGFSVESAIDLNDYNDEIVEVVHDGEVEFKLKDASKLEFEIKESCLYGDIRINLDGTITYKSLYGYQGYDTLVLTLEEPTGGTKDITIIFKVTKES